MHSVIVVEGAHDASKIKAIFKDVHIIITGGTAVSEITLNEIEKLSKTHEVILFLDPDYPGNQIRNKIKQRVPNVKEAFIEREKAKKGKKVGVEHASFEDIKKALKVREIVHNTDITKEFLMDHGYIGTLNSKEKRLSLTKHFNIGYVNAKGLLPKLSLFGIKQSEVVAYEAEEAFRAELSKK